MYPDRIIPSLIVQLPRRGGRQVCWLKVSQAAMSPNRLRKITKFSPTAIIINIVHKRSA